MKKLLYIVPHLSTGGMPQYLLKQIEHFKDDYIIQVIEHDFVSSDFVVQRNKIHDLCKVFSLRDNKSVILDIIKREQPDIIHFQEIPETFVNTDYLNKIFDNKRNYDIVITTHSSYTEPSSLIYLPDKFVLVSEWSKKKFAEYFNEIECDIFEYPIEYTIYDKSEAQHKLGFDPNYKHVLHVGLFTDGKNQGHIFEVARKLEKYKILFHFVGNQAGNFEFYWGPLMKNKPKNCIIHGEKENVDDYYKASDLFYFPSRWELNPISVKEALSYQLPVFLTKLHTYENTFDNIATYVDDNIDKASKLLLEQLNPSSLLVSSTNNITTLHILTDIDTNREIRSMQSLTKLEDYNIDYVPIISKRYTELPPADTCAFPEIISMEPGGKLTPAHYGCYLGHRKAFETGVDINNDFSLICECDCIIDIPYDKFIDKVKIACDALIKDDLLMFSFGYHHNNVLEKKNDYWIMNEIIGAHAYLIPRKSYPIFTNLYNTAKWNVTDLFFGNNLRDYKIGVFETPIAKQAAGLSILENTYNNNDRY